ncbi:MAG: hypothetical protein CMM02_07040 [Rhodopirellula sp.]|nr:hypothetical protein [Rhodopirellula sp.]|tara:strand:- start:1214 stop:1636 length:423 start_codon:yes stop_codon:yes gene_type:complete
MDVFAVKYIYDKLKSNENFENKAEKINEVEIPADVASATIATTEVISAGSNVFLGVTILYVFLLIIWLLLAIWAVSLSWSSNTVVGYNPVAKGFFAFFAFFFATSYLFSHLIHKLDLLYFIDKLKNRGSSFSPTTGGKRK